MAKGLNHERLNRQKRQNSIPVPFKAQFQSQCRQCSVTIQPGELVEYAGAGVKHIDCPLTQKDGDITQRMRARRQRLAAERALLAAAKQENTALRKFFADNDIPLPQGVSK